MQSASGVSFENSLSLMVGNRKRIDSEQNKEKEILTIKPPRIQINLKFLYL